MCDPAETDFPQDWHNEAPTRIIMLVAVMPCVPGYPCGSAEGKPMQLVERHVIKRTDPRFVAIDAAAFASKNLYNAANYIVRQSFIAEGVYLNYPEMDRRMQGHEAYQALPAKVAQWVLRFLDQNWESFFASLTAWQKDPTKFLGKPKPP